jgi:hypothetical protein
VLRHIATRHWLSVVRSITSNRYRAAAQTGRLIFNYSVSHATAASTTKQWMNGSALWRPHEGHQMGRQSDYEAGIL